MSRHKNFVATNLSFFATLETCRDINFFVEIKLLVFKPCFMLRHKLEMSRHKIKCVVTVFCSIPFIFCCDRNFCLQLFNFVATLLCYVATFFFWFFSHFIVTIISFVATNFLTVSWVCCHDMVFLCCDNNFFCRDRVSHSCLGLLL